MGKRKSLVEKISFLKNAGLLLSAREKVLNNFKGKIFPTKNLDKNATPEWVRKPAPKPEAEPTLFATPRPAKERAKNSSSKFYENIWDKIANDKNKS